MKTHFAVAEAVAEYALPVEGVVVVFLEKAPDWTGNVNQGGSLPLVPSYYLD